MAKTWVIWALVAILVLFIYLTKAILLPFVAGLAIAYLLDPLADKLETWNFPRWLAATTILCLFFLGITGLFIGITPIVKTQITGIMRNAPQYLENIQPLIDGFITDISGTLGVKVGKEDSSLISQITQQNIERIASFIGGFLSQGMALFNLLSLLLISPVVAFFLLRDWDLLVAKVNGWLPKKKAPTIRIIASDIDRALAGFVRGQTMVSLSMAILYAIGWSLAGLNFGIFLGLLAGILAYVPFLGALVAAALAVLVGIGQFGGDFSQIWPIVGVFIIVQTIEAAFLTPKFIGDRVGLHPVWVLFAIFAGSEIMGFVGVLIALPVAAAIGVLVRFIIDQYLESHYHKDDPNQATNNQKHT